MKNLKRVLSLALASLMLVGTMVVGAGAADYNDFTDKDEITHTEAVSTLVTLNVINGKDDGRYDPKGFLTRAEMAKLVVYVLHGGEEPALPSGGTSAFTDTADSWAKGYIEYCASTGIINGVGGGKFDPTGTLTGSQAAKMLLVAMGYNASVFGLEGTDWEINTNVEANKAGLYAELKGIDPSAELTRDDAAQLMYNALGATMMERTWALDTSTGKMTEQYTLNGGTLLDNKFGVLVTYGVLVDVGSEKFTFDYDTNYGYDSLITGVKADQTFTKVTEDYSDLLGQMVKIMYRKTDAVVGVAALDCNTVYELNRTAISVPSSTTNKVRFDSTNYTLHDGTTAGKINLLTVDADGAITASNPAYNAGNFNTNTTSYDKVTFVDINNDGNLEYAVVRTVLAGKVTYVSSSEVIVNGISIDPTEHIVGEDVVKSGYASITVNPFTGEKTVTALTKGTASASVNSSSQVRFDDTWYYVGGTGIGTSDGGKEYDYYTLNGVVVSATQNSSITGIDNAALILAKGSGVSNQVRYMTMDGAKHTVEFAANADGVATFSALVEGRVYTYSETSSGVKFAAIAANDELGDYTARTPSAAGSDLILNGSTQAAATTISSVGTYDIADNAIVILYTTGDKAAMVITGKQLKSGSVKAIATVAGTNQVDEDVQVFTSKSDGLTRATIIVANTAAQALPTSVSSGNEMIGLITKSAYVEDSKYITYNIWTGEENVTVKEEAASSTISSRTQFTIVTYEGITDGIITDVAPKTLTDGTTAAGTANTLYAANVVGLADGDLWITDTKHFNLTSDTIYMYVDTSTTTSADIGKADGELVLADEAADGSYISNIWFMHEGSVEDGTCDVTFVMVDIKNKLTDSVSRTLLGGTLPDDGNLATVGAKAAITGGTSGKVVAGDVLTLTLTNNISAGTITLTNAVFADTGLTTKTVTAVTVAETTDVSGTFSIIATGGNIAVAGGA